MDTILSIGCIIGGLFGLVMSFYLGLCFIQWFGDVIEQKRWRYWIK
jgi:hypothetical protein